MGFVKEISVLTEGFKELEKKMDVRLTYLEDMMEELIDNQYH